jgi:hypothetical protein
VFVYVCVCVCVCIYVCMCVDICVCVYVFIQDPDPESDPESDPKLCEKSDPDPKKIIPDPQHCLLALFEKIYYGEPIITDFSNIAEDVQ